MVKIELVMDIAHDPYEVYNMVRQLIKSQLGEVLVSSTFNEVAINDGEFTEQEENTDGN